MAKGTMTFITLWVVACAIMGTSAAAIAKYGHNGITIAHLVLSILAIFFIVMVSNAIEKHGDGSRAPIVVALLFLFCIWLPLLILLFADPSLRPEIEIEEQQFVNESVKRGESIKNPAEGPLVIYDSIDAPISSGLYFGLALLDSAMLSGTLGGIFSLFCCCSRD